MRLAPGLRRSPALDHYQSLADAGAREPDELPTFDDSPMPYLLLLAVVDLSLLCCGGMRKVDSVTMVTLNCVCFNIFSR